mgnify:CR=1 FL=1
MATKPASSEAFEWATLTNFTSGPASGQPTKVDPPGWPTVTLGFIPDDEAIPEWANRAFAATGSWTQWLLSGSAAGAADAHVVETDASGYTAVQRLTLNDDLLVAAGSTGGLVVRADKLAGTAGATGRSVDLRAAQGQDATGAADNGSGGNIVGRPGAAGTGGSGADGRLGRMQVIWSDGDHQAEKVDFTLRGSSGSSGNAAIDTGAFEVQQGEGIIFEIAVVWEAAGAASMGHWTGSAAIQRVPGGSASVTDAGSASSNSGSVGFTLSALGNSTVFSVTFPGAGTATIVGTARRATPNANP